MNNSQIRKLHKGLDHIKSNKLNPKGLFISFRDNFLSKYDLEFHFKLTIIMPIRFFLFVVIAAFSDMIFDQKVREASRNDNLTERTNT